jgi:hypothetical protein
MGKRPVKRSEAAEPSPIPAFLVACVLIGLFAYRLTVPAHESPLLTELVLTVVVDSAMVVGLVVLRARLPRQYSGLRLLPGWDCSSFA